MKSFIKIIFVLFSIVINSQNSNNNLLQKQKKIDSIFNKSIEEERNNTLNVNKGIIRMEECYKEAKKYGYKVGAVGSSLITLYVKSDDNDKIVRLANDIEKQKNIPPEFMTNILRIKAMSLGYLGFYNDSYHEFKKAFIYAKEISNNDVRHYRTSLLMENFTSYFENSQKHKDSILYYQIKSLEEVSLVSDKSENIPPILKYDCIIATNISIAYYYFNSDSRNLKMAEKHLLDALKISEKNPCLLTTKLDLYDSFSDLYYFKNDFPKAIEYANKTLKMEMKTKNPYIKENSYKILSTAYLETNKKDSALYYQKKYLSISDSLKRAEKDTVSNQSEFLKDKEKETGKKTQMYIILLALFVIFVIISLWKINYNIQRNKYKKLITKIQDETNNTNNLLYKREKNFTTINNDTLNNLLIKLQKFENVEKFLKPEISLTWLSNYLDTNPKYLSQIIRDYKNNNFNGYINTLRIDYITKKLHKTSSYREYKISYLAKECGFSSVQVFVIAFKKETGITPSYFIDHLKKNKEI